MYQKVDPYKCPKLNRHTSTRVYVLTPSDIRTDKSVRKRRPAVTFVRIYPYRDFAIEIWGFYRRLTDTLRYHPTRCSRASGLQLAAILQMFTNGRKVEFNRSCLLFLASFGKLRLSDQVQFITWHGIQRRIIWIFCHESEVSG